jgi:hypothetical protein
MPASRYEDYLLVKGKSMEFKKHQCQNCGGEEKLVETIIDDRLVWDKVTEQYEPCGFADEFEHTGIEICAGCHKDWTGE